MSVRELNVVPVALSTTQEDADSLSITLRLPATKTLEVKWRGVDAAEADSGSKDEAEAEEEAVQVTATHEALHTITDGVLQSNHALKYVLDAEQTRLRNVCFAVLGASRVTSVAGHGVQSWRAPVASGSGSPRGSHGITVEVVFKTSLIADTVVVLLTTEVELAAGEVTVPTVVCEGVLWQTGSFGIAKLANVEVHEHEAKGVTRVGVDELSTELKSQTNRSIMFAYKYLAPQLSVVLSVVKHEQAGVLEVMVESAYYQCLVVDTQSMHHLLLVLQNSRQQYLEVRGVPAEAQVWSLNVNSVPAKPVRGKDGSLLVPLLVGTSSDSNEGVQKTSVELAYLSQHAALGASGTLNIGPPRLDVPISTLLCQVQWPEEHIVTFAGALQAVPGDFSYPVPNPVCHSTGSEIVRANFNFRAAAQQMPQAGVSAKVPESGQRFRFERLLVVADGAALTASYRKPPRETDTSPLWKRMISCGRRKR
eukprot:NODE_6368_length_1678_cov_5.675048.p1 GENE.NODE_6368_length_1678_cov_5.675048~~NODE_6368_length_1678_cov_5.675048.p1  ORF type:complete len:522 (+),score=173.92 NODE_6368_length_1678_cov_5.675048:132-1568(+)